MMKTKKISTIVLLILVFSATGLKAQEPDPARTNQSSDSLVILWTSDDPMLAERMVLMYTHAAKTAGWFEHVTLIIWGPSAKLTAENMKIREKLTAMQNDGVVIEACVACANAYGVTEELKALGFDVKGMGKPLTDYLKSGKKVMTF
ncbi:MAG: DsrE family protein [Bacteroidales bacterium]|nr:DsrE family protein [Bacteroidales bacterium]MDT8430132.1 DsrE family protein [Bacteroidales bacterium]